MKGLRFGQYHGWGGIQVPMIDLLSSMPQGTGASTSGSNNQPKYESGTYTSGHNEAVHEELTKIQELEGLANVQKGLAYQAYTKGDHATMNEHIVNYQLLLNDANKYKTAVDFARPEMERYHTRWENEESNFSHLMQNMATKDAKPFIYNAISNDDLKNMSVTDLFLLTSQPDYNPSFQNVYSKLEDRNNTLVYNPRLGRYEVGQDFGYMPDRWGKDTDFTKKLYSEFQQVASHKFQSFFGPGSINAFDKGDAISYGTLTDNYNQVANFVANYKNWMTDDERSQLNSTSLSSYLRDKQSISVFSLSDPKEFLSTDGFKSLGVLITEGEHEYTDDKGNRVKKPSYTYTFNPYYAMFERDEDMNFIANDDKKTIIAGPDGKIISGVTIKNKNGNEITPNLFEHGSMNTSATDFTQGLTNIPELYLQNQVEGMKGSYLEELKDRDIKLKAEGTTSVNIDMRDEIEEYLTNYWYRLQGLSSDQFTTSIAINGISSINMNAGSIFTPSNTYTAYNTEYYSINLQGIITNPLKLENPIKLNLKAGNQGLWVFSESGYTVLDADKSGASWADQVGAKIIYFTGEAVNMPKTFSNFGALEWAQPSFANHVTAVNFNDNTFMRNLIGGTGPINPNSKEYKDYMNSNDILWTPNGYSTRISGIHKARMDGNINNNEYVYALALFEMGKYLQETNAKAYQFDVDNIEEKFMTLAKRIEFNMVETDGTDEVYGMNKGDIEKFLRNNPDLVASTAKFLIMAADAKEKTSLETNFNKEMDLTKNGSYIYHKALFKDYKDVYYKDRIWNAMFHNQDDAWANNFHNADTEEGKIVRRNDYPMRHVGAYVKISMDDMSPDSWQKLANMPLVIEKGSSDHPTMSTITLGEIAKIMKKSSVTALVDGIVKDDKTFYENIKLISEEYDKYIRKNKSKNKKKYPRVKLDHTIYKTAKEVSNEISVNLIDKEDDYNNAIYMKVLYLMDSNEGLALEGYDAQNTTIVGANSRFQDSYAWKYFLGKGSGTYVKHK